MKNAVIFDLGNTLVSYYTRDQWPGVLRHAIAEVGGYLDRRGVLRVKGDELDELVASQRGERPDHRVVPLAERLGRIFQLTQEELAGDLAMQMCRCFLGPIFALARLHDDVLPTLADLRRTGVKTGILSNTPWGSPGELWREELERHGLLTAVDAVAFCVEAGYRKPDPRAFELILERLGVPASESVFVGDDPRWDIAGPQRIGMDCILIDRTGNEQFEHLNPIRTLTELNQRLLNDLWVWDT